MNRTKAIINEKEKANWIFYLEPIFYKDNIPFLWFNTGSVCVLLNKKERKEWSEHGFITKVNKFQNFPTNRIILNI